MKKNLLSLVVIMFFIIDSMIGQTVWNGPTITFTKAAFADPTLAANQDRIRPTTWITRGNTQGIYNIFSEAVYAHDASPANTEWATGTLANYASLTYRPWETWAGGAPNIPNIVGRPAVLHIISENIYIGITFTSWGAGGGSGGSFSYQRTTPPVTAPVKLAGFFATKKNNTLQLNWSTASEENTMAFEVERSSNGKEYSFIGTVQASGNSTSVKAYSFTDVAPMASNFYRLKTIDNNGSFSYSNIVAFKFNKVKKLELFPIPVSFRLQIQVEVSAQTNLLLVDATGRTRKIRSIAKGDNAFAMDVSDFEPGLYFLKVENETRIFIKE